MYEISTDLGKNKICFARQLSTRMFNLAQY